LIQRRALAAGHRYQDQLLLFQRHWHHHVFTDWRTTGLYDRRNGSVALDEVERVVY
jgi:hypothetical protein